MKSALEDQHCGYQNYHMMYEMQCHLQPTVSVCIFVRSSTSKAAALSSITNEKLYYRFFSFSEESSNSAHNIV